MTIFVPKETHEGETRVPMVPGTVTKLIKLGAEVQVETGAGGAIGITDQEYVETGAAIATTRKEALGNADLILRLRKPPADEVARMKTGAIHVSYLDPFNDPGLVQSLAKHGIGAICMEMIPRTTIAQSMDALSSQASLGGYVAVLLAANRAQSILPMMMTPAGTIRPARVFVIGAGVAGLQAIATAKRLGAAVSAFDTRPVVEEQVRSLGAQFLKIDLGAMNQTEQGYATALSPEQIAKQRETMAEECSQADIVITTAQVFGKKAPMLVTTAMVERMRPGSVVIDMAIESGGNVECAKLNEEVNARGVKVIGYPNLPGRVPGTASRMYSNNLGNLVEHFWNREQKAFVIDPGHSLLQACLVTYHGEIRVESIRNLVSAQTKQSSS